MNIEILYDPKQEAAENYLSMDERHELLPDGEWIRAVRRATKRDRLFVYHHSGTGNFVLAEWVYDDSDGIRVCIELGTMPHPPDLYREGRPTLDHLRWRCCMAEDMIENMHQKMRGLRNRELADREEGKLEKSDAINRLNHMGMFDAAHRMEIGQDRYIPEAMGGESFQAAKDELQSMAQSSSRIITHG